MKELFVDNRELIVKLAQDEHACPPDGGQLHRRRQIDTQTQTQEQTQIARIVELLVEHHDPRYIDFLMSICTCKGEPVVSMQRCVTERLIAHPEAAKLLPRIEISRDQSGRKTLRMLLHGPHDATQEDNAHGYTIKEPWIDIARFRREERDADGKLRDWASKIMQHRFEELRDDEKKFRYFVRCSNLFGKVSLGRNQASLRALLCNKHLGLTYETIREVMGMETLPMLVRSRFTTLMRILFVDRWGIE